jgi:hypothetical protein
MTMKRLTLVCFAPLLVALVGCEASKSSTPLSPSVAGPIPGIEISAPKPLEPVVGAKVAVDKQPVTLLIENPSSNGPRPLTLAVEVATDVTFTGKVYEQNNIAPGEGGRTSLRLPDPLAPGRSYYWRARAEDGANTGPFSAPASFEVFTPIEIGDPVLVAPINNIQITTRRPKFTFINAPRIGPVGPMTYVIEFSTSFAFAPTVWTSTPIPEQPKQTTVDAPIDAPYDLYLFWRVRGSDGTHTGPWSVTQAFRTPDTPAPAPPPPPPPGGGGGGGAGGGHHVGPGPLSEARAKDVVFATAREFPHLTSVFGSEGEAVGAADQLLRRTIWHLQLAGYQASGQKNPSGAISSDKLTIFVNGAWHVYDVYSLGVAGRATTVQFFEVPLPNPYPRNLIPD